MPLHARYRHGEEPKVWIPGSLVLVYDHKPTITHELIQARERATLGHTAWANLTHCVCVTGPDGSMVEANAPGIQAGNMSKYKDADYWVIIPAASLPQRELAVARWNAQVGDQYDKGAFIAETLICFGLVFGLMGNKMFICSGLGCFGALAWEVSFPIPFSEMTPGEVARFYNVPIDEEPAPLSFTGRVLDRVVLIGRLLQRLLP